MEDVTSMQGSERSKLIPVRLDDETIIYIEATPLNGGILGEERYISDPGLPSFEQVVKTVMDSGLKTCLLPTFYKVSLSTDRFP